MKILILLLAIAFMSCNNSSSQKKLYEDSAQMMADSLEKYKPGIITDDSTEIIRKGKYTLYKIMFDHYKEKAEK